jgi:signal transduction histidine kinase
VFFAVVIVVAAAALAVAGISWVLMLVRRPNERREAERAMQRLSARILKVQDEEQRRLARLLHETTAQNLAALRMNLTHIQRTCRDEEAAPLIGESIELANRSIQEIRTLSYLLHPPLLDEFGLSLALRWYVTGFEQRSGIRVTLDAPEDLGRLPREHETAVFRIVQEALTNVHRHSGSAVAHIRITRDAERLALLVQDEGDGFAQKDIAAAAALGVGIAGMQHRVQELGGTLKIDSTAEGTRLSVDLPLKALNGD